MAATLEKEVLEDELAVSLARAVAAANERARREGIEIKASLVTVTEHPAQGYTCWRINYGPRDYMGRRGGDLMVEVGLDDGQVKRVLRGQ
jgi:predicted Holliday junction resolvase-like endonuclease